MLEFGDLCIQREKMAQLQQLPMSNHKYYNFKQRVNHDPKLLTMDEIKKLKIDPTKEHYISIFRYNDEHKKIYATGEKPSVKGSKFHDVLTDVLVWDFDDSKDPENARQDVIKLAHILNDKYNVDPDEMSVYYSGNKGFHLSLQLEKDISQEQFKNFTAKVAEGLPTYDPSVCDPPRLLRMERTANPKTGLYKIPMHIEEVSSMPVDRIKELAQTQRLDYTQQATPVQLPDELFKVFEKKVVNKPVDNSAFDPKSVPKGWKPYKWALADGFFESGERHQALMVIASTCRALGYDKESTYYQCKSALKKQARRSGQPEFDKEELYKNIIEDSVFSDGWEGGSYSPTNNIWLKQYCERMGFSTEEKEQPPCVDMDVLTFQFTDYATNFEQNIIKTGIIELDNNIMFSTSTLNGVLGQPGAGKTSWALKYLRNASLTNVPSLFVSADMGAPLVYGKLVQECTGFTFKKALELYKTNPSKAKEISSQIKGKYKHVGFNFRSGLTVADIRDVIIKQTEVKGIKPKLVVIDYLECLSGPYSDPTANAGFIANQLKDLANDQEVCVVLLLQTQKHSTPDIADPLMSMKQIKGSSVIEQACSTVLTLWREGYNPKHIEHDKYISFAVVKNRFGPQWQGDFAWEPIRGNIRSLTEEERDDLKKFIEQKKKEKSAISADKENWDYK